MGVKELLSSFIEQSKRVVSITHKPRQAEYRQMALTTAVGMAIIGLTGFAVAMVALLLRGKLF